MIATLIPTRAPSARDPRLSAEQDCEVIHGVTA
jgi:hypothetical protein